ncbi:MAG: hypothetical protein NPIRA03_38150 [Nitrospirales bacterium]|nr:MAG: hypothetical protein NPIRA03_38150 [Nitrospirales bacterium]
MYKDNKPFGISIMFSLVELIFGKINTLTLGREYAVFNDFKNGPNFFFYNFNHSQITLDR